MSKRVRLHENILTGLEVLLITVPHENIPWIFIILNNLTFSHANWKAMINSSKRHELSGHHRMNQSYAIQSYFNGLSGRDSSCVRGEILRSSPGFIIIAYHGAYNPMHFSTSAEWILLSPCLARVGFIWFDDVTY